MTSRVRLLLGLVAILAAMRFVVVPWTETQADMHDRLYAITRQLDRAEAIVDAGSELQARRDALAAIVRELAERAPMVNPGSEHRVQVQRELRAAVESVGLKLNVFEWVLDGEIEAAGRLFGRVRLQAGHPVCVPRNPAIVRVPVGLFEDRLAVPVDHVYTGAVILYRVVDLQTRAVRVDTARL